MVGEDIINEILKYLKDKGPTNTFRLAGDISLERHKLLNILNKLEEKGAVEFKHGLAMFNNFVSEEKPEPAEIKESSPKPKKKVKRKPAKPQAWQFLQAENKQLKEKLLEVEETVETLKKKVRAHPKVITKTIIKKVPVTKTIVKEIPALPPIPKKKVKRKQIKKKTKKKAKKKVKKKLKIKSKTRRKRSFLVSQKPKVSVKFKLPKFKLMKNIKKLKKPEFVK